MTPTLRPASDGHPQDLLTLVEVADLIGRDLSTVKRYLRENRWAAAVQDSTGRRAWRVPASSLVAAGDLEAVDAPGALAVIEVRREPREVQELRVEVARLQERLSASEARVCEYVETIAFLREVLHTLRLHSGVPESSA